MMEKNEEIKKDYHLEQAEKQLDKAKDKIKQQEELKNDLKTDPRYKDFFSSYRPDSVESFIKEYAEHRSWWIEHGEWLIKQADEHKNLYLELAYNCLWEIQQKKLFNFQCEWRAEKIKAPEVRICWDFNYWERHIKSCSFIPPITSDEVELYIQYLKSDNVELNFGVFRFFGWQDYDEIKEAYQKEGDHELPEWYQFYDTIEGTGILLSLPDIRTEKEKFYMDLWRQKNIVPQMEEEKKIPQLPYLSSYGEDMEKFLKKFESKHVLRCYEMYHHKKEKFAMLYDDRELEGAIETLLNAKKRITLSPSSGWRQAIIDAANYYEAGQIADHMFLAYEEYKLKIETGLLFTSYEENDKDSKDVKGEPFAQHLIEGRILNGDPPDLNF